MIVSDLHLGSPNCQAELFMDVLKREQFDRLVLNGDTLNNLNLRKLDGRHWEVVTVLRDLARSRELILVRGNHDHDDHFGGNGQANGALGPRCVLPALLGVAMVEEYKLEVGARSYLILHGVRFDPTLNYPVVTDVADQCYQLTQKLNKKLAKWLKKKSKRWGGVLEWVRSQSIAHARRNGYAGVVTGHTHFADDVHEDDIHYLNSGCWTEPASTFIVAEGNEIHLRHVPI